MVTKEEGNMKLKEKSKCNFVIYFYGDFSLFV